MMCAPGEVTGSSHRDPAELRFSGITVLRSTRETAGKSPLPPPSMHYKSHYAAFTSRPGYQQPRECREEVVPTAGEFIAVLKPMEQKAIAALW